MRILILGAGGIGGYFGARLQHAGADVHFLVRPPRAEILRARGLRVHSPLGDLRLQPDVITRVDAPADVVLLSCKAYDINPALDSIEPAMGPHSAVVPLLNGVAHLDALDRRFGRQRVAGGVAHLALTLDGDGDIRHLNSTEKLIIGARADSHRTMVESLGERLAAISPDYLVSADIEQDMWDKLVFISVLAGATCLMRAPVGVILATHAGGRLIDDMLAESAAVASACGHAPAPARMEGYRATLTESGSTLTASMLRDLLRHAQTEAEHILGDLCRRAEEHALQVPMLDLALSHLQAYETRRVSESSG
ncbi:ketopantoate reductase family protein [Methyloversatilis thermotolerans]|uniref:ketopantoate reductase family protein n=1 Tax=Methyloversatilis thermotolerans TaxID=1346290 RepID=UPI0004780C4B|nr:ketopantoate reductase family protein [Methyloversatilis thermotolerans]